MASYVFTVAQIFNLPYRRFVIGRASDRSHAASFPDVWQSATLRYSRLQVCATGVGHTVNTHSPRGEGGQRRFRTRHARVRRTPRWVLRNQPADWSPLPKGEGRGEGKRNVIKRLVLEC